MKYVVTGGTGFVGGALVETLLAKRPGAEIVVLSRDAARARGKLPTSVRAESWRDVQSPPPPSALEGATAVFHLAGETAVGRRLTADTEREIRESRLRSTASLVEGFRRLESRPSAFVCASAIGYYGARSPDAELSESSPPGDDFLARLCVDWEKEAGRAAELGIRTTHARLGIVLGLQGGALPAMMKPISAFVGGRLGSGAQIVSWIHRQDCARALLHLATSEALTGPLNLTAPEPASNDELTRAIARRLSRPAAFPVPAFALRALFGKGADALLEGQKALPRRLLESGFTFRFPTLGSALDDLLGER